MDHAFRVTIFDGIRLVFEQEIVGAIELGRQRKDEPGPLFTQPISDGVRIVVAELTEVSVSRQQVRIEARVDGHFMVRNMGTNSPIQLKPPAHSNPASRGSVSGRLGFN